MVHNARSRVVLLARCRLSRHWKALLRSWHLRHVVLVRNEAQATIPSATYRLLGHHSARSRRVLGSRWLFIVVLAQVNRRCNLDVFLSSFFVVLGWSLSLIKSLAAASDSFAHDANFAAVSRGILARLLASWLLGRAGLIVTADLCLGVI